MFLKRIELSGFKSFADKTEPRMSGSISVATEEQTTSARQVAEAVENVNERTQQVASAAGQMSDATVELSRLAQRLNGLVQQFALDRDSSGAGAAVTGQVIGRHALASKGGDA
jgi:chromosome segregation ATPase